MTDEPKLKGCWNMERREPTRVVQLTDKQVDDMRGELCMDDVMESLGKIVLDVISRGVRAREKSWRLIYELVNANRSTDYVRVNWISQSVEVWEGMRGAMQAEDHFDEVCQSSAMEILSKAISSRAMAQFWTDLRAGLGDTKEQSEG